MNDRFKFRIFYNNKMFYPNDYQSIESIYECLKQQIMWDCAIDVDFKFNHIANNLVFMQCTGLKDKNGKLIYEGDIVNQICEDETTYKCEVVYNNCSFQLKHIEDKNKNYINTPMYCYAINYLGHYTEKRLEVIGNIYENPELLKECE